MIIRKVKENDADGIAYVSAYSWFETYQGLVSEKYLNEKINNIDKKAVHEKEYIRNNPNGLVAIDNDSVIGFCYYGKDSNNIGEIGALYLLKKYQGQGIGKKLFFEAIKKLLDFGCNEMIIECMCGNNTINFYKKYGGQVINTKDYVLHNGEKVNVDVLKFEDITQILELENGKRRK